MNQEFDQLYCALKNLAADAVTQRTYLSSLGLAGADELALELSDAPVDLLHARGVIGDAAHLAITQLDEVLSEMSGEENTEFWDIDSLTSHPVWRSVRSLALTSIRLIHDSDQPNV